MALKKSKSQGVDRIKKGTGAIKGSQAERILKKFGGARNLSRAFEEIGKPKDPASIFRWTYPHPKGTGGRIPVDSVDAVLEAARREGILLTAEDWDPRVSVKKVKGTKE